MVETYVFSPDGHLIYADAVSPEVEAWTGQHYRAFVGPLGEHFDRAFRACELGRSACFMQQTNEGRWLIATIPYYGVFSELTRVCIYTSALDGDSQRKRDSSS